MASDDWVHEKAKRDAYPETDLLVGQEGAMVSCPYCDTGNYLHQAHVCHTCGAEFEVDVRWSR